jgi:hypothetical protein
LLQSQSTHGFSNLNVGVYHKGQVRMSAIGWQQRLEQASCEEDVVDVCRDFLAPWTPEEIAQLPASCRPGDHFASGDVTRYALKLIGVLGIGNRATAPMLHRMSTFFTRAALRVGQITVKAADLPSRERRSGTG